MTREAQLFEQFRFQNKGTDYLKLCIDATVYWVGSVFERVEGVLDFYQQSLEFLRDHWRFYLTETMEVAEPIRDDTTELLPFWLRSAHRRDIYILRLESAPNPNANSDRAFEFRALEFQNPPRGALRLVLPPALVAESAARFIELAQNLVRKLKFSSGHGGYAINWNKLGLLRTEAKNKLPFIAARFPGVDLGDTSAALYAIANGIKRSNWLTLLDHEHCDRLGGADALRTALGDDISVYTLENGCLIQAGPHPLLGDTNRQEALPLYHRVGRVLAPLRSQSHPAFLREGRVPSAELTERWLAHFDH
jgi:hypothetical protein